VTDFQVTVDTAAVEEMIAKLQQKLAPASLTSFLIAKAHSELRTRAEERFAQEGDDVSGPWAELTYATGRIRSFKGFQPFTPINVRTGALKRFVLGSFTVKQQSRGVTLMMPGPANGDLMDKFRTAQQGSAKTRRPSRSAGPNRPTPARPVLGMNERDAEVIQHELIDWIRAGVF
jgi:hypothetical protein